ncbi:MAG: recombinase family protein [Oscillospiraceae bacterium]|nr:recombinase family protein [Oscillospiraceae bacterium]
MDNRITAVYGRQSVDKKDSISIESQLEFCRHELRGGSFREYTDKGFSGKNTDRPKFQELIRDIRAGLVQRVVVYKLDRISRSILDFANMMELFQEYDVEFISSTEKFDTSTPMGRAMLNICIVFAQLERETIQKRVTDAYHSRSRKGFRMGGRIPYGFDTEPIVMDGVKTKQLVSKPADIKHIKLLYEMYAQPEVSLGDIARRFTELGIQMYSGAVSRLTLTKMLRNPVYVQADMDVYEFFKSQGTTIVNDVADFTGVHGCYLYQGRGMETRALDTLAGMTLVLAPHEGVIPSDLWLTCRRKSLANKVYQPARKASKTWLVGKVKCGNCGYALVATNAYFGCKKRMDSKSCEGAGTLKISDAEALIYQEMAQKLRQFHILHSSEKAVANPKVTALKVEFAQVEAEIEQLLASLMGASDVLISYANVKIQELDTRKQEISNQLADYATQEVSPEQLVRISELLDNWGDAGIEDKRVVADSLLNKIMVADSHMDIQWKI